MKFSEYNSFPEDMEEMTPESWQDFFHILHRGNRKQTSI